VAEGEVQSAIQRWTHRVKALLKAAQPKNRVPRRIHPRGTPAPKPAGKAWLAPVLAVIASSVLGAGVAFAGPLAGEPLLDGVARATFQSSQPAALDARLTLRVYNYAHLDRASLDLSENVASRIFEAVGIETVWVDCPVSKSQSWDYRACESAMGPTDLVLRILPQHMAAKLHVIAEALGAAQQCSEGEPACELNVFYHHVDELATKGYRGDRILGYVIAHEVAHVLIGPGHSDEGIMRGEWTADDLQRISWAMHLGFTNDQPKRLREAVLRRTQLHPERRTRADLILPEQQKQK
jgi:hypothetical protein